MNYFDATSGYSDYINNLNAAWLMYPRPTEQLASTYYERVVDGMERIPEGLHSQFMNHNDAVTMMGKTVTAITKLENGNYRVSYEDTVNPADKVRHLDGCSFLIKALTSYFSLWFAEVKSYFRLLDDNLNASSGTLFKNRQKRLFLTRSTRTSPLSYFSHLTRRRSGKTSNLPNLT